MKFDNKPLFAIPDLVPEEHISQLRKDSIDFIKINKPLIWHQIEINRLISDRINNCKELFPLWINWSYLRKLFIMPDGLSEDGNEQASQLYYANKKYYPYQVYVNWNPADEEYPVFRRKVYGAAVPIERGPLFRQQQGHGYRRRYEDRNL